MAHLNEKDIQTLPDLSHGEDTDEKLRRRARKLMAQYRSTGNINVL